MDHLRDIAGQEIHAGDIIAFVGNGGLAPGLKIGRVISTTGGRLVVWGIDDDFPAISRPKLSKAPFAIQSTNRIVVLDRSKIRRDYIELLAGVGNETTFRSKSQRPISSNKPAERHLTLVPQPNPRR